MSLMGTWSPPPAVYYSCYYYLFMHLLVPSCRLEMGWGIQVDPGMEGLPESPASNTTSSIT